MSLPLARASAGVSAGVRLVFDTDHQRAWMLRQRRHGVLSKGPFPGTYLTLPLLKTYLSQIAIRPARSFPRTVWKH